MPGGLARVYEIEAYSTVMSGPVGASLSSDSSYQLFPGDTTELRATLVNRTSEPVTGSARFEAPEGWTVEPEAGDYEIAPYTRAQVTFSVTSPAGAQVPGEFPITVWTSPDDAGATMMLPIRGGVLYSDDGAPTYTETGTWAGSGLLGHNDTGTRYAWGETGATATWTPDFGSPGTYRVHVWSPAHPDTTTAAHYSVTHADGTAESVVNSRDTGGAWHSLGRFEFAEGSAGSVTLSAVNEGHHRVNAVWFERVD